MSNKNSPPNDQHPSITFLKRFAQLNFQRTQMPNAMLSSFTAFIHILIPKIQKDINQQDMKTLIQIIGAALANFQQIKSDDHVHFGKWNQFLYNITDFAFQAIASYINKASTKITDILQVFWPLFTNVLQENSIQEIQKKILKMKFLVDESMAEFEKKYAFSQKRVDVSQNQQKILEKFLMRGNVNPSQTLKYLIKDVLSFYNEQNRNCIQSILTMGQSFLTQKNSQNFKKFLQIYKCLAVSPQDYCHNIQILVNRILKSQNMFFFLKQLNDQIKLEKIYTSDQIYRISMMVLTTVFKKQFSRNTITPDYCRNELPQILKVVQDSSYLINRLQKSEEKSLKVLHKIIINFVLRLKRNLAGNHKNKDLKPYPQFDFQTGEYKFKTLPQQEKNKLFNIQEHKSLTGSGDYTETQVQSFNSMTSSTSEIFNNILKNLLKNIKMRQTMQFSAQQKFQFLDDPELLNNASLCKLVIDNFSLLMKEVRLDIKSKNPLLLRLQMQLAELQCKRNSELSFQKFKFFHKILNKKQQRLNYHFVMAFIYLKYTTSSLRNQMIDYLIQQILSYLNQKTTKEIQNNTQQIIINLLLLYEWVQLKINNKVKIVIVQFMKEYKQLSNQLNLNSCVHVGSKQQIFKKEKGSLNTKQQCKQEIQPESQSQSQSVVELKNEQNLQIFEHPILIPKNMFKLMNIINENLPNFKKEKDRVNMLYSVIIQLNKLCKGAQTIQIKKSEGAKTSNFVYPKFINDIITMQTLNFIHSGTLLIKIASNYLAKQINKQNIIIAYQFLLKLGIHVKDKKQKKMELAQIQTTINAITEFLINLNKVENIPLQTLIEIYYSMSQTTLSSSSPSLQVKKSDYSSYGNQNINNEKVKQDLQKKFITNITQNQMVTFYSQASFQIHKIYIALTVKGLQVMRTLKKIKDRLIVEIDEQQKQQNKQMNLQLRRIQLLYVGNKLMNKNKQKQGLFSGKQIQLCRTYLASIILKKCNEDKGSFNEQIHNLIKQKEKIDQNSKQTKQEKQKRMKKQLFDMLVKDLQKNPKNLIKLSLPNKNKQDNQKSILPNLGNVNFIEFLTAQILRQVSQPNNRVQYLQYLSILKSIIDSSPQIKKAIIDSFGSQIAKDIQMIVVSRTKTGLLLTKPQERTQFLEISKKVYQLFGELISQEGQNQGIKILKALRQFDSLNAIQTSTFILSQMRNVTPLIKTKTEEITDLIFQYIMNLKQNYPQSYNTLELPNFLADFYEIQKQKFNENDIKSLQKNDKTTKCVLQQPSYRCLNPGCQDKRLICYGCSIVCHKDHPIIFVDNNFRANQKIYCVCKDNKTNRCKNAPTTSVPKKQQINSGIYQANSINAAKALKRNDDFPMMLGRPQQVQQLGNKISGLQQRIQYFQMRSQAPQQRVIQYGNLANPPFMGGMPGAPRFIPSQSSYSRYASNNRRDRESQRQLRRDRQNDEIYDRFFRGIQPNRNAQIILEKNVQSNAQLNSLVSVIPQQDENNYEFEQYFEQYKKNKNISKQKNSSIKEIIMEVEGQQQAESKSCVVLQAQKMNQQFNQVSSSQILQSRSYYLPIFLQMTNEICQKRQVKNINDKSVTNNVSWKLAYDSNITVGKCYTQSWKMCNSGSYPTKYRKDNPLQGKSAVVSRKTIASKGKYFIVGYNMNVFIYPKQKILAYMMENKNSAIVYPPTNQQNLGVDAHSFDFSPIDDNTFCAAGIHILYFYTITPQRTIIRSASYYQAANQYINKIKFTKLGVFLSTTREIKLISTNGKQILSIKAPGQPLIKEWCVYEKQNAHACTIYIVTPDGNIYYGDVDSYDDQNKTFFAMINDPRKKRQVGASIYVKDTAQAGKILVASFKDGTNIFGRLQDNQLKEEDCCYLPLKPLFDKNFILGHIQLARTKSSKQFHIICTIKPSMTNQMSIHQGILAIFKIKKDANKIQVQTVNPDHRCQTFCVVPIADKYAIVSLHEDGSLQATLSTKVSKFLFQEQIKFIKESSHQKENVNNEKAQKLKAALKDKVNLDLISKTQILPINHFREFSSQAKVNEDIAINKINENDYQIKYLKYNKIITGLVLPGFGNAILPTRTVKNTIQIGFSNLQALYFYSQGSFNLTFNKIQTQKSYERIDNRGQGLNSQQISQKILFRKRGAQMLAYGNQLGEQKRQFLDVFVDSIELFKSRLAKFDQIFNLKQDDKKGPQKQLQKSIDILRIFLKNVIEVQNYDLFNEGSTQLIDFAEKIRKVLIVANKKFYKKLKQTTIMALQIHAIVNKKVSDPIQDKYNGLRYATEGKLQYLYGLLKGDTTQDQLKQILFFIKQVLQQSTDLFIFYIAKYPSLLGKLHKKMKKIEEQQVIKAFFDIYTAGYPILQQLSYNSAWIPIAICTIIGNNQRQEIRQFLFDSLVKYANKIEIKPWAKNKAIVPIDAQQSRKQVDDLSLIPNLGVSNPNNSIPEDDFNYQAQLAMLNNIQDQAQYQRMILRISQMQYQQQKMKQQRALLAAQQQQLDKQNNQNLQMQQQKNRQMIPVEQQMQPQIQSKLIKGLIQNSMRSLQIADDIETATSRVQVLYVIFKFADIPSKNQSQQIQYKNSAITDLLLIKLKKFLMNITPIQQVKNINTTTLYLNFFGQCLGSSRYLNKRVNSKTLNDNQVYKQIKAIIIDVLKTISMEDVKKIKKVPSSLLTKMFLRKKIESDLHIAYGIVSVLRPPCQPDPVLLTLKCYWLFPEKKQYYTRIKYENAMNQAMKGFNLQKLKQITLKKPQIWRQVGDIDWLQNQLQNMSLKNNVNNVSIAMQLLDLYYGDRIFERKKSDDNEDHLNNNDNDDYIYSSNVKKNQPQGIENQKQVRQFKEIKKSLRVQQEEW